MQGEQLCSTDRIEYQRRKLELDRIKLYRRYKTGLEAVTLVSRARVGVVEILLAPILRAVHGVDVDDRVLLVDNVGPELVQVGRIRKMTRHADDGNVDGLHRRLTQVRVCHKFLHKL